MEDDVLAKAEGLHIQVYVKDGKLIMKADADPGCKTAMHYADQVLRLAPRIWKSAGFLRRPCGGRLRQ